MRRVTRHNNVGGLSEAKTLWPLDSLPPTSFLREDDHSRSTPQTITSTGVSALCLATFPCLLNVTKKEFGKHQAFFLRVILKKNSQNLLETSENEFLILFLTSREVNSVRHQCETAYHQRNKWNCSPEISASCGKWSLWTNTACFNTSPVHQGSQRRGYYVF